MNRKQWKMAYRYARNMQLGTLYCAFGRKFGDAALEARDFTRVEPTMPAKRFYSQGWQKLGKRIA